MALGFGKKLHVLHSESLNFASKHCDVRVPLSLSVNCDWNSHTLLHTLLQKFTDDYAMVPLLVKI